MKKVETWHLVMGQFDIEVIRKLGREPYDYILNRVRCGVISAQHMKDISQQLHEHVAGRHLQRLETGSVSDEAEFRNILGDWWNKEMHDLDQETALGRLVSIFTSNSVSLN